MRYLGPVHFRYAPGSTVSSDLEGLARTFLGQLQGVYPRSPTKGMFRAGPGWAMKVMFVNGRPVVDIRTTEVTGGEGESSLYLVALDSGVLMFSSRQVERQPPQNSAIQPSWLGRAKIIGGSIASFDNRHAKFTPAIS